MNNTLPGPVENSVAESAPKKRVFLFLQGHPSTFARNAARMLEARGHTALHINFCLGDRLLWWGHASVDFKKPFSKWEPYLSAFIKAHGVTDILYYGDRKPYHQVAAKVGRELGIASYTFEFGYLRPGWITLEREGMSAFSHFPNDPEQIRAIAKDCAPFKEEGSFPYSKRRELFYEVSYTLINYFTNPVLFPFYKCDRYYNPIIEYLWGIPGLFVEKSRNIAARKLTQMLAREKHPYFLFSLQLQSDYQLRSNSPFKHQKDAIALTMQSFAAHASEEACLLFKAHPLDNGREGWPRFIARKAREFSIEERVFFVNGGNLSHMLQRARGCVMINSTVGLHAVRANCPVKVLGFALYDMVGLTHQGSLDRFWTAPEQPNPALTEALVTVLADTIQLRGNFFTTKGQRAGLANFVDMLLNDRVNGKGCFVEPPPRRANLVASEPPMFDYVPPAGTDSHP